MFLPSLYTTLVMTLKRVLVFDILLCVPHWTSYPIFQASAMKQMRTALSWAITQRQYIVQGTRWISEHA
jgi:hypothetical protein